MLKSHWMRWLETVGGLLLAAGLACGSEKESKGGPSAHPPAQFNLDGLTFDRKEILSGGPGKDGIPALTKPKTVLATQADFLRPDDRVVTVSIGEHSRAYPIRILNWHEAINDTLGGVPIAVIYCPLCDSVSVVDRRLSKDKTLEFGISGLLLNSNVLLYDRTDQALWSQVGLTAISGPHVGESLKHLPWKITPLGELTREQPKATVITIDTGHRRDYARSPYVRYFTTDQLMFPVSRVDKRLKPKTVVVGVQLGEETRAYPLEAIRSSGDGILKDEIKGQTLVLQAKDGGGVAVVEAPEDAKIVHTFWFAWAAFHPHTSIHEHRVEGS